MIKKIVCFILAFTFLICCCMFSASAEGVDDKVAFGRSLVDLLVAPKYTFILSGNEVGSDISPSYTIPSDLATKQFHMRWNVDIASSYSGFLVGIQTSVKPSSVKIRPQSNSSALTLTYIKSSLTTATTTYFYRLQGSSNWELKNTVLEVNFSANYSGLVAVNTCYGMLSNTKSLDTVDDYTEGMYWYDGFDHDYLLEENGASTLPIGSWWGSYYIDSYYIMNARFFLPASSIDCISFIFSAVGIVDPNDITFSLWSGDNYKFSLPVEVSPAAHSFAHNLNEVAGGVDAVVEVQTYLVNVDLSGVDLSLYTGILGIKVNVLPTDQNEVYYAGATLTHATYKISSAITPWYVSFYNWISGVMNSGYQAIVNAITGSDENAADGEDMVDQSQEKLEEAEKIQEDMNVTKPSISPPSSDDEIGGMLTGSGVAPMGSVLSVITGNSLVTKILLLVFTLALCAYVFFGKRR